MAQKKPRKNYCVLAGTPRSQGGDGVKFWSCHTTRKEAKARCSGIVGGAVGRDGMRCKIVNVTGKRTTSGGGRKRAAKKGPCVKWSKRRCLKRGRR